MTPITFTDDWHHDKANVWVVTLRKWNSMGQPKTPRTDALFGIFLQDISGIREKHPRTFGKKYYRFDYAAGAEPGYCLSIEPDNVPKIIKREIIQAFDRRLNQDLLPVIGQMKRNRKAIKPTP